MKTAFGLIGIFLTGILLCFVCDKVFSATGVSEWLNGCWSGIAIMAFFRFSLKKI